MNVPLRKGHLDTVLAKTPDYLEIKVACKKAGAVEPFAGPRPQLERQRALFVRYPV